MSSYHSISLNVSGFSTLTADNLLMYSTRNICRGILPEKVGVGIDKRIIFMRKKNEHAHSAAKVDQKCGKPETYDGNKMTYRQAGLTSD